MRTKIPKENNNLTRRTLKAPQTLPSSSERTKVNLSTKTTNRRKQTLNIIRTVLICSLLIGLVLLDIERQKKYTTVHKVIKHQNAPPSYFHQQKPMPSPLLKKNYSGRLYKSIESYPIFQHIDSDLDTAIESNATLKPEKAYPLPNSLANINATIYIEPIIGKHRSNMDAIFSIAEDYPLEVYVRFITFLRKTNFEGDLILSVSSVENMKPDVESYLRKQASPEQVEITGISVIIYEIDWMCNRKNGRLTNDINADFVACSTSFYGNKGMDDKIVKINDPREPRHVTIARYELYWIWCLEYEPESRILLVHARDTYFQLDPFKKIPKLSNSKKGGVLYFFEENHNATSIFRSKRIQEAYKNEKLEDVGDKPLISSDTTIGDAIAIESYLRLMVKQIDDYKCKMLGCDLGILNHLIYHETLSDTIGIGKVVVYPQGQGLVNNLGAMKVRALREWGILSNETNAVLNWDGSPSPIVHQFDQDKELNEIVKAEVERFKK